MKLFRKIIAVICSIAISFSVIVPSATAVSVGEAIAGAGVVVDFFGLAADMYDRWKDANPDVPDSEYPGFHPGGTFGGGAVRPRPEEFEAAYSDYVGTLPATGYTSAGKLLWQPSAADVTPVNRYYIFNNSVESYPFDSIPIPSGNIDFLPSQNGVFIKASNDGGPDKIYLGIDLKFTMPLSGSYRITASPRYSCKLVQSGETIGPFTGLYPVGYSSHYNQGTKANCESYTCLSDNVYSETGKTVTTNVTYLSAEWYFPVYEVIPDSALSSDTYSTTTRPTSISGGNYGVVGDNNEITKVEDNSTIINETNNTYYNPATGTTVPITDWSYNYSDRSYKVTMESGDTATITYGDENISITETNTTSGDTVTNNYTIYYLVDGPDQSACTHEWAETSTTPATCTVPGSKLFTCSLCSLTKTESIPVLGHDWEVKKTVTTQYDETGQLTQQGYTVFECGTCHEQYKSEDGVLPPAVTPGTGTDIAAVDALKEKLQVAIEAVLGIFNKLPELFNGFTDFLAAVFPFVPSEFITIFELGLFLLIAAAALRKFLS